MVVKFMKPEIFAHTGIGGIASEDTTMKDD
jgi:hypothetical protein